MPIKELFGKLRPGEVKAIAGAFVGVLVAVSVEAYSFGHYVAARAVEEVPHDAVQSLDDKGEDSPKLKEQMQQAVTKYANVLGAIYHIFPGLAANDFKGRSKAVWVGLKGNVWRLELPRSEEVTLESLQKLKKRIRDIDTTVGTMYITGTPAAANDYE